MNMPVIALLDKLLVAAGTDSTMLGNGSIGLISAPFAQSKNLTMADIVEANYSGYARLGFGNPTVPFTGGDGIEYVEGNTVRFMPSDTVSVNSIYGFFWTPGSDTTKLFVSDVFATPLPMFSPHNQITITPRFGLNPAASFGANVVSN